MKIIGLPAYADNYIWTLVDDNSNAALCIDPGQARPVTEYLKFNSLSLDSILLTHHHPDHIDGVQELVSLYPEVKVYGPPDQRIPYVGQTVVEGDTVNRLNCHFSVLEIPGHTATHICYYEHAHHLLFCGDTLFSAGCGRVFDGSYEQLFASLQRLSELPKQTKVYCGHEYTYQNLRFAAKVEPDNPAIKTELAKFKNASYSCSLPSTIGRELKINPFLRVNEPTVSHYALARNKNNNEPFSVFRQLRHDKNEFKG